MKGGAAALEQSRDLACELGQLAPEPPVDWNEGVIEDDHVPSGSRAHTYRIVRTAGGWQHANADCWGYLKWQHCKHVDGRNRALESTALVMASGNALTLIDELEDEMIVAGIRGELAETWIYQFPQGNSTVTGVSSKGVENGCRELAKKGEAIRELDVRIDFEDDNEARFVAKAGRYGVSGDGREVLLDTAIRGKRQLKNMKRRDGTTEEDPSWYEKGVTKAVRNAKLALMPDSIVALIIAEAKAAGRVKYLDSADRQPPRQVPQATRPQGRSSGGSRATEGTLQDAMGAFWGSVDSLKVDRDTAIAKCQEWFGNREPAALTSQERTQLLMRLKQEKPTAAAVPEPHAVEMVITPSGDAICDVCGQPVDGETGEHIVAQASLAGVT